MSTEQALDARARRAAYRAGYIARKTRWRSGTVDNHVDNHGGFALIEPRSNFIVLGSRYDLSAKEVIEWCADKPVDDRWSDWPPDRADRREMIPT
jgi:hypothetical protein